METATLLQDRETEAEEGDGQAQVTGRANF